MEQTIAFPNDSELTKEQDIRSLHPFSVFNSRTGRHPEIAAIVAMGRDRSIGTRGGMIWHLPADLRHFKTVTMGHPVIMGRKTWESLPKGALPGRRNIVVTRNAAFRAEGAETSPSLEDALNRCTDDAVPFIIGGAQIYSQAMPWVSTLYLTEIDAECDSADAYFPEIEQDKWETTELSEPETSRDGISYRFRTLRRKER